MKKILLVFILCIPALSAYGQDGGDDYVSCRRVLEESDLEGKSLEELRLLRNEIFARNGYVFTDESLQGYFESRDWYSPAASNHAVLLSDIERDNVARIKKLEDVISSKRKAAILDLKRLKDAVNANDRGYLDRLFSSYRDFEFYEGILSDLKTAMNHIDLDRIHWNNGRGLYKVTVDDGYKQCGYYVYFEGDEVCIKAGDDSHSEIFGEYGDPFSDYMSEDEYQIWWRFRMSEDGLTFRGIDIAG